MSDDKDNRFYRQLEDSENNASHWKRVADYWETEAMRYAKNADFWRKSAEDWKCAAQRAGEELTTVGPRDYYNWSCEQWLDWFLALPRHSQHPPDLREYVIDVFKAWPEDVRKKLSLHDLHRMWEAQYGRTDVAV